MEGELPKPEGLSDFQPLTPQDGAPYHLERISKAASLQDLTADYVFFSHALLLTHAGWNRDPVSDYVMEVANDCCPFLFQMPKPIFDGLVGPQDDRWNYRLLGIMKSHWDGFFDFMKTLGAINRDNGRFHKILVQELPMMDVLAVDRMTVLPASVPMVSVTLFGIDGNWAQIGFTPAKMPPIDRIRVATLPPNPEMQKLADELFDEKDKPYKAIETPLEESLKEMSQKATEELRKHGRHIC